MVAVERQFMDTHRSCRPMWRITNANTNADSNSDADTDSYSNTDANRRVSK